MASTKGNALSAGVILATVQAKTSPAPVCEATCQEILGLASAFDPMPCEAIAMQLAFWTGYVGGLRTAQRLTGCDVSDALKNALDKATALSSLWDQLACGS